MSATSVARRREQVAAGLATAFLAGPWRRMPMIARAASALGRDKAPKWLAALVDQVRDAYREAPVSSPRELAAYLQVCPAWTLAWQHRRVPRVVEWTPVPTTMSRPRWRVTELPDLAALARLLDLEQGELDWFADVRGLERRVAEPLRHYRWRALPRPGGVRLVAAPKPRLKEIQRRLLRHVLEPIPLHQAAHGCVRGRSVRTALAPHAGAPVVVRADLETFFASIPAGRVWSLLREALPEGVAHTITGLLTTVVPLRMWQAVESRVPPEQRHRLGRRLATPHLPLGAPTSPAAANLVAFALDRRLDGLAERFGAEYTRYVDDLTFSGGSALRAGRARFVAALGEIVRDEGFAVNERKSVVLGAAGRQAALGAVINSRPTLPREERDRLRAILHNCTVHGWRSQARDRENLREHLLGRVSWAAGLDPLLGTRLRAAFDAVDWT